MIGNQPTQTIKKLQRATLPIFGMTCWGGGALPLERALQRVSGVRHVYVNAATEMAYVEYALDECNVDALTAAIQNAGFEAGLPSFR
jgi:P-type Cu+ transporter